MSIKVTLFSEKHIKIFFKKFLTYHQNAFTFLKSIMHITKIPEYHLILQYKPTKNIEKLQKKKRYNNSYVM